MPAGNLPRTTADFTRRCWGDRCGDAGRDDGGDTVGEPLLGVEVEEDGGVW